MIEVSLVVEPREIVLDAQLHVEQFALPQGVFRFRVLVDLRLQRVDIRPDA